MMEISAQELGVLLNGKVEGNAAVCVTGPSKIEEGIEGTISFLGNPKYENFAYTTSSSILLVDKDFKASKPIKPTLIRVDDVYSAVAILLENFGKEEKVECVVSKLAHVDSAAHLGQNISIGAFATISKNASIGNNSVIYDQVSIGANVSIGQNVIIYPGVKIYKDCVIGDHCVLHANAVIGSDGFGFAPQKDGTFKKIPQLGNVVLEDYVEVGAQTIIDRASMGSTILRRGVKLDNLIQIAHNVEIGENTVIASQTGVAGSTKIGKNCMIGGQVGFAGHLKIGDNVKIQAQSGIGKNIKENEILFGSPAMGYTDFIKSHSVFKKLPHLYKQIGQIQRELDNFSKATKD